MEEQEIIRRCLAGEIDAYEHLVRTYQSPLLSLAWNILGNREDARDAVQDSLVAAYCHLAAYDPCRSFRTWIFSITVKRCIDFLRKRRSFLAFFRQQAGGRDRFLTDEPSRAGIDESQLFSPLLQKLGKSERTAMILRINEEYSCREIAEALGCSESTARAHLLNAKRKLKRWLERMRAASPAPGFWKELP
jgi:RNA polymerase sigma-70 factor (ECF subfamily)